MRVLVTGGTGFVGSEAVRVLCDLGHDIAVLGRTKSSDKRVRSIACDIMDAAALKRGVAEAGASHLLHLAWYAEAGKFWNAPCNLDWVAASLNLARAFADSGGSRLVVAGSCAEYQWNERRLDERETLLRPQTLYGVAKASLFQILERACPELSLSLGWGRIFFPYGPYESSQKLLGSLLSAIETHTPANFSSGHQLRDFIHVHDVARAFSALLGSDVSGAVNIGSGHTFSVRQFIEMAARIGAGEALIKFGARPMQEGEPPELFAATDRLYNELGFSPVYSVQSGLEAVFTERFAQQSIK